MAEPKNPPLDPDMFVSLWHEYGLRFSVFVPAHQPRPDTWDPGVEEFDNRGRVNPHYLKHWRFLSKTKQFLRDRYAEYHILEGPTLFFDCLVEEFQNPMRYAKVEGESGPDFFEVKDTHVWYEKAIRMGIFDWQVGFSCRSVLCQRGWCPMHKGNPHRINHVDIYGLLTVFERIPAASAKTQVGKWFNVKLGELEGAGIKTGKRYRRKVSKKVFYELLPEYKNVRDPDQVKELIGRLHSLIKQSPLVEWHGRQFDEDYAFLSDKAADNLYRISGPAVKAYVWLLIRQEEMARNTRGPKLSVTDSELAKAIGVTKRTACSYRDELNKKKLIEISKQEGVKSQEVGIVKVKY